MWVTLICGPVLMVVAVCALSGRIASGSWFGFAGAAVRADREIWYRTHRRAAPVLFLAGLVPLAVWFCSLGGPEVVRTVHSYTDLIFLALVGVAQLAATASARHAAR